MAFVQQGREDFEWVCAALSDETIMETERVRYLFYWGWIVHRLGNSPRGLRLLEQAKEMIEGTDSTLTLQISNNMALVYSDTGQPQKALQLYEQALPIRREVGDRAGEAATLIGLASLYQSLQRYEDAGSAFKQSIILSQQITYPAAEIAGLIGLAFLFYQHLNRPADAILSLEQALQVFAATGLSHDGAGQTVEQVQQWLAMMRDENIPESPSTSPLEMIEQIVSATIAVMTTAPEHRFQWHEQITHMLQDAHQLGEDWQAECDFFTAILAILDGQTPMLPPDHPYIQAIEAIQKGMTPSGGETL